MNMAGPPSAGVGPQMPHLHPGVVLPPEHGEQQAGGGCHQNPLQICKSPFHGVASAAEISGADIAQGDACLGGSPSGLAHHAATAPPLAAMISGSQPTELQLQLDSRGGSAADAISGGSQGTRYSGPPHIPMLKSSGRLAAALHPLDASLQQSASGQGLLPESEGFLGVGPGLDLPLPRQPRPSPTSSDKALRAQLRGPSGEACHFLCPCTRHRALRINM